MAGKTGDTKYGIATSNTKKLTRITLCGFSYSGQFIIPKGIPAFALFLVITIESFSSNQALRIDSNTRYPVIPENAVRIYCHPENLSPNRFIRQYNNGNLEKKESNFSFGYSNKIYWALVEIENRQSTPFDMVFEVNNPFIDRVYFYCLEKDKSAKLLGKGGDRMKFDERPELNRRYIFRDKISPQESKQYLLKVDKRNASVSFPIRIWDEDSFAEFDLKQNIANGGITVTLGLIAFLSLLSAFLLKNRLFLSYGLYVLVLAAMIFSSLGYSFQFIYPESTELNQYCRPVLGLIMFFLMVNFFREFVDLSQHYPLFNRAINWVMGAMVGLTVLWFILNGLFYDLAQSLIIPALTILFSADLLFISGIVVLIILLWRKAYPRPQIFLFSIGIPAFAFGLLIMEEFGWITLKTYFPVHPLVAGSFMEVTVLSGAMIYILSGIVKERKTIHAQNANEGLQADKTRKIQDKPLKLKNNELVRQEDIMFVQSSGHYVEYYLQNENSPLFDRATMMEVQARLNSYFIRSHRYYIVNINFVNTIYHDRLVLVDGSELKVSRTYKDRVRERINAYYGRE